MKLLEKVKRWLGFEYRDSVELQNQSETELKHYDLCREARDEEWEKQFHKHDTFKVMQNGKTYTIVTHFKEKETRKKEITSFVKEGLEKHGDMTLVIINIGLIYNLGTATRGVKEENKILLFFSEE